MLSTFTHKCRVDIEQTLHLPRKFAIKNADGVALRLIYITRDGTCHSIEFITLYDVGLLLKKFGIIHFLSMTGDQVNFFTRYLDTTTGANGQPIQTEVLKQEKWDDIEITRGQAITIAADHELKRNKVFKKFIRVFFKAA